MTKKLIILALAMLMPVISLAKSKDIIEAESLTERILPEHAKYFEYKQLASEKDSYTIESSHGKIIISGNNANSMAVGLNHYLKRYCNTTVSWYADVNVEMPENLPVIQKKETASAKVGRRFFLNYCTYGYTMPFWTWKEWERLIDWMALNGINMPLAITGQEAVWYNVWSKLGMTDKEIRNYFTGPTYLPWHRMANIDKWNGPLPKEWLDKQTILQKQILERERALNMKPVLPAFAGHVPAELKKIYPEANIQYLGEWAGFDDAYRCHFLNPEEPLFAKIQKLFLDEQTKLFGTDHIYGVDPFNEVDPPSWEPKYLKNVSKNMYNTLKKADPEAEWMQMTWMFYHDKEKWTSPRIKSLLTGVKEGKMWLLDYHCEKVELWKSTNKFHGQPYIWCYLGNFGGNTTMTGNVKESGKRLDIAMKEGGKNLQGIGSTLEGLDVAQFPYEYIFEKAWTSSIDDNQWIENLADRHLGKISQPVRSAWKILFNDIYVQVPRTLGVLPNYRPELGQNHTKRISNDYNNSRLIDAWKLLIQAQNARRNAIELDLIIVGRQVLGNYFAEVKANFDNAFKEKNLIKMDENATLLREILYDLDKLNSFNSHCTLQSWIAEARNYGSTPEIKDYYEHNARNLITTWGGKLNDYASRTWAGLINEYYSKRWNIYINMLTDCAANNKTLDANALEFELSKFENEWVKEKGVSETKEIGDIITFSKLICLKYGF